MPEMCPDFIGCRKCRHGRKTGVGREVEGGLSAAALAGMLKPRVRPDFPGCGTSGFGGGGLSLGPSSAGGGLGFVAWLLRGKPWVEASYRSVGPGLRQLCNGPGHRVIRPQVQRIPFREGR
ncbi:hypothetical protein ABIE64_002115 [Thalassospira sp. MBR-102]